jgi:hypothetical protein
MKMDNSIIQYPSTETININDTVFTRVFAGTQFSDRNYKKKNSWNIMSGVEIMNYEYNSLK